ncbi:MAG: JAB domain-containing protein [Balneolaceae bacterium]
MIKAENTQIQYSPNFPECKISYSFDINLENCPQVTTPEKAYEVFIEIWDMDTINYREEFVVLLLNNSKRVVGWSKISTGGSNATIVEPAMIFQVALLSHANSMILAHNHPSGRMEASSADTSLTKRLKEIGNILGIRIDDHLIISPYSFVSMNREKVL